MRVPGLIRISERQRLRRLLRPLYHRVEDMLQGDILKPNVELRARFQGARCFLLCTGTSLNELDVTLLRDEYTFGCGQLHSPELDYRVRKGWSQLSSEYAKVKDVNPAFYAVIDPVRNITLSDDDLTYFLNFFRSAETTFRDPSTIFFVNGSSWRFVERHGLLRGRQLYYVKQARPMRETTHQLHDIAKRITFMDGSLYFMIAASIYMGFTELYLCGCGYTFQPQQIGHYYENWSVRNSAPVDARHRITRRLAEDHGVRIVNIVPEGFDSPIYEKTSWAKVRDVLCSETGDTAGRRWIGDTG